MPYYFSEEIGVAHISKYVWNIMQEPVAIWLVIVGGSTTTPTIT
jgi:hypothetical protein